MVCFRPDSILVGSARNWSHVTPATPFPAFPFLTNTLLPPFRERERERGEEGEGRGGGEGPPLLGSQSLNQTLSHPVNLKQSGFNSSCLSVPAPAWALWLQPPGGQRRRAWDAPEDTRAKTHTHTQTFPFLSPHATLFSPHLHVFLPCFKAREATGRWCQGLVFEGCRGSLHCVCAGFKLGSFLRCVRSLLGTASWDWSVWIEVVWLRQT